VLAIIARQVNRLLIWFRKNSGGGLIHKGRSKSSNHSLCDGVRGYVFELVKTKYADFGPMLATEDLQPRLSGGGRASNGQMRN
jgi:hypothetical protein